MNLRIKNVIMLAVGLFALWLSILCGGNQAYTPDSADYIDQARSFTSGNGFQTRLHDLDEKFELWAPDKLFPPGYPIIIAIGTAVTGVPAEVVAPWVSRIALLILPLTIFISFRQVIGGRSAAWLGIITGVSPGVLLWGQFALSDVLSLTLVVASFGFTLSAASPERRESAGLFALAGGVFAGFSYLIRNANLALLAATSLSMFVWLVTSKIVERQRIWRFIFPWTVGASIVVFPWMIRNLIVFGKLQPYEMPSSTIGAWENFRSFIAAITSEISGSSYLGTLAGWSIPGLIVLLILLVIIIGFILKRWSSLAVIQRRALVFSCIYVLAGSSIVIAARTKYQWGEAISNRHTLQYAVFLLLPLAILLRNIFVDKVLLFAVSCVAVLTLVTLRGVEVESELAVQRISSSRVLDASALTQRIEGFSHEKMTPCARNEKSLVISNYAYLYRAICDVDSINPGADDLRGHSIVDFAKLVRIKIADRPLIIALHPDRGVSSSELPLKEVQLKTLLAQGWAVQDNSSGMLLMSYGQ